MWPKQSRSVCPLEFHMASLCFCDSDVPINLIATARSFWERMTSIMNWLLCHISLSPFHLDPCRLNCFQVNVNPTVNLQSEGMIYVERSGGIAQESNPFFILNTKCHLLQKNSRQLLIFFSSPRHPQVEFPVGISKALNYIQRIIFRLGGWKSLKGFKLWRTKEQARIMWPK